MRRVLLLLIFVFSLGLVYGQVTIYSENFTGQNGKGAVGPTPTIDLVGVNWTIDISSATLSATTDWFRVVSERFEARDIDGDAIWYSPSVSISGYTNVQFSLDASEQGTMEPSDIFDTEYRINGGTWTTASTNGSLNDDFSSSTVSQTGLSGATLEIRVTMNNGAGSEYHRLDNILIEGTAAGCSISSLGLASVSCNDNSTTANTTDDIITFDLNPIGSTLGTNYNLSVSSGAVSPSTAAYGSLTSFTMNTGSAGGGNVTVTITDATTGTCTNNVLVTDPGTCSVSPCVAPTNQATTLLFSNIATSSMGVAFSAASPAADNYLVVRHTSATLSSNPIDATTYAVSSSLGGGTVVFNGSGTSFSDVGLTPSTSYYYFVFAYNDVACSGGPVYLAPALTDSETTLSGPCQSDNFNAGYGNWTGSGTYQNTTAGVTGNGTGFNTNNDNIVTTAALANPTSITFTARTSGSTSNFSVRVQYSTTSTGPWTDASVIVANGSNTGDITNVFSPFNLTLGLSGTYFLRIVQSPRSGGSFYLDDVDVFCGAATAEIEIQGNSTEIIDGDITPDIADDTDFGTTSVAGGTVVKTFTILNTGGADLTVSSVTSSNASIFAVSAITTPSTIISAGSTTFLVTFDPAVLGASTATITVNSDDADEAIYTFDVTGEGTNSNSSDIIESTGFTYTSNIDYTAFQTAGPLTNATGNVGVFRFEVRDGAGVADADALGTELTGITFDLGSMHAAYIRSAALFDGLSMRANAPTINVGTGTITFSGLSGANFTAADDGSLTLTLRVSFLTNVVDNEQLQFTISNATANTSTSVFATADAGGALSSIVGDRNRLEVTATELNYAIQASDALINIAMGAVEVEAVDVNGNRDLDWTDNVSVTSIGTMTGTPITVAAVAGVATFSGIIHTVAGTGFTLDAAHSTFTTVTSALFDITDLPVANGDYRTTGTGDWNNNSATPAIWERFNGTTWATSNSPSFNTINRMYIRSGHTVTTNGSWGSTARLYILDGGTFINEHNGTADEVLVYENGILDIREFFRVGLGSGTLEVFDGGIIYFDDEGNANLTTSLWNGTETFHPLSELHILDIDDQEYLYDGDVTTNTYNGYTAAFGYVFIDFTNSLTGSTPAADWESIVGVEADGNNLCHNNLEFVSTRGNTRFRFANGVDVTTGVGGDVILQAGIGSSRRVEFATGNAGLILNIEGNLEVDCPGDLYIRGGNSAAGSATVNIKGHMLMNGPNVTSNSEIRMNGTNYGTANGGMNIVNLEGDLLVENGFLHNWAARDDVEFNFIGTILQTVSVQTVVSDNGSRGLPMYVRNGASVILAEHDLQLDNSSFLNVQDGGTFNFGFDTDDITALIVTQPGSASGSNVFDLDQGGRLYITSTDGITTTASVGNVQVSPSNRTYNQTAFFHYIGRANQVTGNALTSTSTGKHVFCQLIDDNITLTPSNDVGISNGTTLGSEGRLKIDTGKVIGTDAADFQGTGLLIMTGGWYDEDVSTTHNIAPQLEGAYTLRAGTVELSSAGDQTLRGARDYFNLMISGSNTSGIDDKTPTSAFTVDNLLTVTGTPIFDISNIGMTGDAGIEMDGGLLRISKLSITTPELTGINLPYTLTGGTVEWYGSASTQSQVIRGTYGASSTTVSYRNIEVNSAAANTDDYNVGLQAGIEITGVTNINSPAVFQMDPSDHIDGTGTFNVLAGSTYKYGDEFGITLGTSTATTAGALRMSTARTVGNFSTDASYGFVGNGDMVSGDALPASCVNLYTNKTLAADEITLTNSLEVKGDLSLVTGIIVSTNSELLSLSNGATATGASDDSYVSGPCRKIGVDAFEFPVGKLGNFQAIAISAPAVVTDHFTAEYFQIDPHPTYNENSKDVSIHHISSCEYWILDRTNGSSAVPVELTWDANSCGVTNLTDLLVARWDGTTWKDHGNGGTSPGSTLGAGSVISMGIINSFSPFTLASTTIQNPLPVELLYFEAKNQAKEVLLSWSTVTEINNEFFTVERSANGSEFEPIGEVAGAGNYSGRLVYKLLDENPLEGVSYYRLKQTDFDGRFDYSEVKVITRNSIPFEISQIFPNPVLGELHFSFNAGSEKIKSIEVLDMLGKTLLQTKELMYYGVNTLKVDVKYLNSGTYVLKIKTETSSFSKLFIKK